MRGINIFQFASDKRKINLGGKNSIDATSGDRLIINTPGGGGYGGGSLEDSNQLVHKIFIILISKYYIPLD